MCFWVVNCWVILQKWGGILDNLGVNGANFGISDGINGDSYLSVKPESAGFMPGLQIKFVPFVPLVPFMSRPD